MDIRENGGPRIRKPQHTHILYGEQPHPALTTDAITLYKHALTAPRWNDSDLPAEMGLDGRRLAAAMRLLQDYRLIQPSADPARKWEAVGPEAALVELVSDEEIRLKRTQATITKTRQELLSLLPAYFEARRRRAPDEAIDMVHGRDTITRLVDEQCRGATGQVCAAIPGRTIDDALGLPVLESAADGCQVRVLLESSIRKDARIAPCQRNLQLRAVPEIPYEVLLFGRTTALLPGCGHHGVAVVRHPVIIASLWAMFELLWGAGEPLPVRTDQKAVRDELWRMVLRHLAAGEKDEVIARRLGLSVRTCRRHIAAIMDELGATSRFQAGVLAQRQQIYADGVGVSAAGE